jgi:hypothetical protein
VKIEPMIGGPDSACLLMTPLFCIISLSNVDLTLLAILSLHTQYFRE